MNVRYRYLEKSIIKDFFLSKEFKKFLISGKYISEDIKNKSEYNLKKFIGTKNFIGTSSGTNSLYLALKAVGIKKNDKVLVPCISWISTFTAVGALHAKPIAVDIDEDYHLDFSDLKKKIDKKVKAVIYVHFGGLAKNLSKLKKYLKKKKIILIEDCAQVFGTKINKKHPGTYGDLGAFSANSMKIFPTIGEAGGVSTDIKKFANLIKLFRYAGIVNKEFCIESELNHKIDNVHCMQMTYNLKKIKSIIQRKIKIAKEYDKFLTDKITKPKLKTDGSHNYYSYIILTKNREKLVKFLSKNKIETKIQHKYLVYDHRPFKNLKNNCPNGNKIKKQILSLPIDENLTHKQVKFVIKKVNFFFNENK